MGIRQHPLLQALGLEEIRDTVFDLELIDALRLVSHAPRAAQFTALTHGIHGIEAWTDYIPAQPVRIAVAVPAGACLQGQVLREARAPRAPGAELRALDLQVRVTLEEDHAARIVWIVD